MRDLLQRPGSAASAHPGANRTVPSHLSLIFPRRPTFVYICLVRRNIGLAIVLGRKLLVAPRVHDHIAAVSDAFHNRSVQACVMGIRIRIRGDRRHGLPDPEAGDRFARDRRSVGRRRQRAQLARISGTKASCALRLRHGGGHAHYKRKNKLDDRPKNSAQYGIQFHNLYGTIISSGKLCFIAI